MEIRIKQYDDHVLLMRKEQVLLDMYWRDAEEMRRFIRKGEHGDYLGTNHRVVLSEDGIEIFTRHGALLFNIPQAYAQKVFDALTQMCRRAEAHDLAVINKMIEDQALMQRAGLPFGLTDNKKMQGEIMKEAHYDKKLRKYLAPKHLIGTPCGVPKIRMHSNPLQDVMSMMNKGRGNEKIICRKILVQR